MDEKKIINLLGHMLKAIPVPGINDVTAEDGEITLTTQSHEDVNEENPEGLRKWVITEDGVTEIELEPV